MDAMGWTTPLSLIDLLAVSCVMAILKRKIWLGSAKGGCDTRRRRLDDDGWCWKGGSSLAEE